MSAIPREPPAYRPLGLLAFAVTVLGGTPIGVRLLAWLYLGASAPGPDWRLLHAHLEIFGFFATLIPGVAQHLIPRFTGRAVTRRPLVPALAALFALAVVLRVVGTATGAEVSSLVGAVLQAVGFAAFTWQVWRTLGPPPLAVLRRQLTGASAAFALAMTIEAIVRGSRVFARTSIPFDAWMRAIEAVGLFAVLGWVLGVLLRAGPMFVPGWTVPMPVARAVAPALVIAGIFAVLGEVVDWGETWTGVALARAGDVIALSAVVAVTVGAGAFRPAARAALPVIGRSGPESRIFRLAAVSAVAACAGFVVTVLLAASGLTVPLLTDAVRHLVTVGFITSIVVAMTFRLIPVLEGVRLPWPWLRGVAFWALLGAIVLRTGEVPIAYVMPTLAPLVGLSGLLVWIALAAVSANLVAAITLRPH